MSTKLDEVQRQIVGLEKPAKDVLHLLAAVSRRQTMLAGEVSFLKHNWMILRGHAMTVTVGQKNRVDKRGHFSQARVCCRMHWTRFKRSRQAAT